LLATTKIKSEESQKEAATFYQLYVDEIRSLRKINADKLDWFPTLLRPQSGSRDARVRPNLFYRQAGPLFGPASRGR